MSYDNTWLCLFNFQLWTALRWNRKISLAPFKTQQPTHHEKTPTQTLSSTLQEDIWPAAGREGPWGWGWGWGERLQFFHKYRVPPTVPWCPLASVSGTSPWAQHQRALGGIKTCPGPLDDTAERREWVAGRQESHVTRPPSPPWEHVRLPASRGGRGLLGRFSNMKKPPSLFFCTRFGVLSLWHLKHAPPGSRQ